MTSSVPTPRFPFFGVSMPSRAGVSAYITKIHIIDTVQHAYDVALDIGTTAWSFVKSRFDDPTSASQSASFVRFDYSAIEVVHLPSEQRAIPPPTRTIGDSAHRPYSSVLTAPAPTVLCKSLSPEAVYRMDGGVRSEDHLYLLHFLAMAVIAFCLVLLRKFLVIMAAKARRAIVQRWKILVGLAALEAIVEQQGNRLDSLYEEVNEALSDNLKLRRQLCESRKRKFLACAVLEDQITTERNEHVAALDRLDAVAASSGKQLELRDEDLERIQQGHDDARTSVAELFDRVTSLESQLAVAEKTADLTATTLLTQLRDQRRQNAQDKDLGAWRINQLYAQLSAQEEKNTDLRRRLKWTNDTLTTIRSAGLQTLEEIEEKETKIAFLEGEAVKKDDDLSALRIAHGDLEKAHTAMQLHLAAAHKESEKNKLMYERRIEDLEYDVDFAHHEYLFLSRDLPRRQAIHDEEVGGLRRQLDFVNHEYLFSSMEAARQRSVHQKEISEVREQVSLLTAERDDLAEKLDFAESRCKLVRFVLDETVERAQEDKAALEAYRAGKKVDEDFIEMIEARAKEQSKRIEDLSEQYDFAESRCKLVRAVLNDTMERAEKDKAALEAYRAGKKVDEDLIEMLEAKDAEQTKRIEELSEKCEFAGDRWKLLDCIYNEQVERSKNNKRLAETKASEQNRRIGELEHEIKEMSDEVQQLHELLQEATNETLEANREAEEVRAAYHDYEQSNAAEEFNVSPSDHAQQSEPTLLRCLFERNLVERYETIANELRASSSGHHSDGLGLGLGLQSAATPVASSSSSPRRSPLSNVTNMECDPVQSVAKIQPESPGGPGFGSMPATPPSQHGWMLDGSGDLPPFPDTPVLN